MTQGGSPAGQPLVCHSCGSGQLRLTEDYAVSFCWDEGLVLREGKIVARGDAYRGEENPTPGSVVIRCVACGHLWHPRRPFDGQVDPYETL